MTDAIRRMLETTAKLWGTPPYLVAGLPIFEGGSGFSDQKSPEIELKRT